MIIWCCVERTALEVVTRSLVHRFDTLSLIPVSVCLRLSFLESDDVQEIKSDILIAHAGQSTSIVLILHTAEFWILDDDWTIPSFHSTLLFEKLIEPHLPSHPALRENPPATNMWGNYTHFETVRELKRAQVVSTTVLDGYAFYEETRPEVANREGRKIAILRTKFGGHNIGRVEAIQDAIARMFNLY